LARSSFGRLLILAPKLHFSEDSFALHPLLQHLERLIDIIISDLNLHDCYLLLVISVPDGFASVASSLTEPGARLALLQPA
jgi:hypothetical protein